MSRQDRWSWFSARQRQSRRSKSSSHAFGSGYSLNRRLHIEPLEDRRMLAVITVTSAVDNTFPGGGVTLREAIQAANTDTSVDGSVAGNGADTINFDTALSGQTITLGGAELEITEALTIDATALAQNVTIDANNASRILNITATTGDFTLAGLTLTGGRTIGDNVNFLETTFSGGAVRSLTTGSLTIDQSTVSGNSTEGDSAGGGGIFSYGSLTLTSSTVSGNSTTGDSAFGGGILSFFNSITLTSSTVSGNSTTGSGADGGAIYSFGTLTLTSSTVSGNSTAGSNADGGGIHSLFGSITLTSSTVSGNSTTGSGADGGGISSTSVTLTNSTVSGNSTTGAAADGGGIYSRGDVTLTNSTVSGNSTAEYFARGGGIFSYGSLTLTNSTVSGNSTSGGLADGGGIYSRGTVSLTSSTITDNHANFSSATGGGIWNEDDTITITHSIVTGNTAGGGSPDIDPGTGSFDVDFSLLGTAVTPDPGGSGNLFNDTPLLGQLSNNGGLTETHALLDGSLAIDAGDPSFDVVATPNDQRGAPFLRGAGLRVDIGAYERQTLDPSFFVVTTIADELDYSNGEVSLREAINSTNGNVGAETILFEAALSGNTITLGGTELPLTEAVTIDATALAANVTIDANLQSRIFNITATTGDFTLAGLTLAGGKTIATSFDGSGGAIRSVTTGSLTIDQSTVSGNSTTGASAKGGAIYSAGDVTLSSSTVSGNSTGANAAGGGGIFSTGNVTLTDSTVSGNSTAGFVFAVAGGIYSSGNVMLTSSTVSGNSTTSLSATGGGIHSLGNVTLTSSTVSGNSTTGSSAFGGGIHSSGDVTLTSSTLTDNHAYSSNTTGGGIWNDNDSDTITITNSIVAGNTAGGSPDIRPGAGTLTVNFSLIGDNAGAPALVEAQTPDANGNLIGSAAGAGVIDPLLGPLANNGGPTETHAQLAGSLAIDAGDPSIVSNPAEFDQRGAPFVRVFGGRIDIGAIEDQPIPVNSADFDGDNDIDGADFLAWQRGFGILAPNASPSDGDANGDQAVDGVDLGIWESQFGQPAPVAAVGKLSAISHQPSAELIDAVMAIELVSDDQVAEAPALDDVLAFAETLADHVFAAEVFTPAGAIADDAERPDTNSNEDDETKAPWLADKLLEQVFG